MGAQQNTNPPPASPQPPVMLVLGDSVMWGQGLIDENKFYNLVLGQLQQKDPDLLPAMLAHSGAIIGRCIHQDWPVWPREVPASGPTIFDQCNSYAQPDAVRVILINGGANDVDIRVFLNPTTHPDTLKCLITRYCHDDMKALLQTVAGRFSNPQCKIVLLGYYPILSRQSDPALIPALLRARGIRNASPLMQSEAAISDPRDLAFQFWQQSDSSFRAVVTEVGDRRITYVPSPFQEQNALFESDPLLWWLNADSSPQDEVADDRRAPCVRLNPDWVDCQTCIRASVGHPNAVGAIKIYEAIMTAF